MLKKNLLHTLKHKVAFLKVEKQLLGRNTLSGYMHDVDKLFLYFIFNKKQTHKIHRSFAKHHEVKVSTHKHFVEMVIDWECARFTKPDKPLNAHQTLLTHYPQLHGKIFPILQELNLVTEVK